MIFYVVLVAEKGLKSSFERAHDAAACYRQVRCLLFNLITPDTCRPWLLYMGDRVYSLDVPQQEELYAYRKSGGDPRKDGACIYSTFSVFRFYVRIH